MDCYCTPDIRSYFPALNPQKKEQIYVVTTAGEIPIARAAEGIRTIDTDTGKVVSIQLNNYRLEHAVIPWSEWPKALNIGFPYVIRYVRDKKNYTNVMFLGEVFEPVKKLVFTGVRVR